MDLFFEYLGQVVIVRIANHNVLFSTQITGYSQYLPIEFIQLDTNGILKEFPELEGKPNSEIRKVAIERFKEKIRSFDNENKIKEYIVDELTRKGYKLKAIQREGFRKQNVK